MKKTIVLLTLLTALACNDSNNDKKNAVGSAVAAADMTEEERLKELERIAKEELVIKRFELLAKEYEDLMGRVKELEHEIKVIKGLE